LWRECRLQTFFAENRWVQYFVAEEKGGTAAARGAPKHALTAGLDTREQAFFKLLDTDVAVAEEDAKAKANLVHGFDGHRLAVVP
jgi:hypothetical protein